MQATRIIAIVLGFGAVAAAGAVALEKTGNLPEALRAEADRRDSIAVVAAVPEAEMPETNSEDVATTAMDAATDAETAEVAEPTVQEPAEDGGAALAGQPETGAVTDTAEDVASAADATRATDAEPITEASGEAAGFLRRIAAMFTSGGEERAEARPEAQPRVLRGGGGGQWKSAREND